MFSRFLFIYVFGLRDLYTNLSFRDAGGSIHIEVNDDGGVYTGEKKSTGNGLFGRI